MPWILVEELPGIPLQNIHVRSELEWRDVLVSMATLLCAFHELPVTSASPDLTIDLDARYRRRVETLRATDLPDRPLFESAGRLLDRLASTIAGYDVRQCFVHRDFSARNLLVVERDGRIEITGVIDFERAAIADPAVDFAMLWFKELSHSRERRDVFFDAYLDGGNKPALDERIVYHTLGLLLEICTWAPSDDPAYFEAAIRAMRAVVQRPTVLG